MSEHDNPLRFNVGFIIAEASGYSREMPFYIPKIHLEPDLNLEEVSGSVIFTRTAEGILAQVRLQAQQVAECGRCLEDFLYTCKTEFNELYSFATHVKADSELILPQTGYIDLSPLVREYVLLETPINPVCKADCKGLCPVCGENLNRATCNHDEEEIDPRLMVLKGFLD